MSHQTTIFCKLLLPSYAIFCHCTTHSILKIGKQKGFLHIALPFTSICDPISVLSSSPHLCIPSSARKYWTLNCLWSWWELRIPSTFRMVLERLIKGSPLQNYFFSSSLLFGYMAWLICTDWLHGSQYCSGTKKYIKKGL